MSSAPTGKSDSEPKSSGAPDADKLPLDAAPGQDEEFGAVAATGKCGTTDYIGNEIKPGEVKSDRSSSDDCCVHSPATRLAADQLESQLHKRLRRSMLGISRKFQLCLGTDTALRAVQEDVYDLIKIGKSVDQQLGKYLPLRPGLAWCWVLRLFA